MSVIAAASQKAAAQAEGKKDKKTDKQVEVKDPMAEIRAKSLTGKFPILETTQGFTIFEASSIAKYFARQRPGFYGSNDFESKSNDDVINSDIASSIDQWVDYVNSSVSPLANQVTQQVFGHDQTDMKSFSILLNQFKKSLLPFEKHLKLRNFLVGYSLTLADVTLVVALLTPLQTVFDQQYRKEIPNLTRFCQLILDGKAFEQTFGRVHFAKKSLQINFPKQEAAKPTQQAKPAAVPKKEAAPVETKPVALAKE